MSWQVRQLKGETFTTPSTDGSCGGRPALIRALVPSLPWQPAQAVPSPLMKASPVPCTEFSLNCACLETIKVVSLWHSVQVISEADGARPGSPCGPAAPAGPAAPGGPWGPGSPTGPAQAASSTSNPVASNPRMAMRLTVLSLIDI